MTLMSAQRKPKHRDSALFLLVIAITVVMRLSEFYASLGRDSGVFAYVGVRVLAGDLPYRDVWDHKAPAVYYLDALSLALSGHRVAGLRLAEIVFAVATAWAIYRLGSNLLQSHWAASLATLSFALVSNSYLFSAGGDLYFTEAFVQFPTVLSIYFAVRHQITRQQRYLFWSGALGGCAILFKPSGGFLLIALALWTIDRAWKEPRRWRYALLRLMSLAAGAALPLTSTAAYFALRGGLAELYSQVIVYNSLYVTNYFQGGFFQSLTLHALHWAGTLGFVWLPAGVGLVWGKGPSEKRRLLVLWFLADLASAMVGGKHLAHYFLQVLPSLALLAGSGWLTLKERRWLVPRGFRGISLISVLIATLLVLLVTQTEFTLAWVFFRRDGNLAATEQAARFIEANTAKEETIYVWGAETAVYFLSGRKSASRYVYLYPLLAPGYSSPRQTNELLQDLKTQKPRYILDASATNEQVPPLQEGLPHQEKGAMYAHDDLAPVRRFIIRQYRPQTRIDEWIVYRRAD